MYIGLWLLSAGHVSTLLHPHCTHGPSPCIYKRKGQSPHTGGWSCRTLSLSLANACNPLLQAHPLWRRTTRSRGFPPSVFRLALTHLGWGMQRQFTHRSRDPLGSKRRHHLSGKGKRGRKRAPQEEIPGSPSSAARPSPESSILRASTQGIKLQ
jgi:hypothetical protein